MPYVSVRGKQFGFDDSAVIVGGRRMAGLEPAAFGNGKTWYVSSAVAGSDGTSPATAVGTIVAATAKASAGDTIIVLPLHAENVAAATALSAVANLRIIGLGEGSQRPAVTFTTANTATYSLAVDGIYIENIVFKANFLSIAAAITLTTAKDLFLYNVEFRDLSGILDFLNCVKSTGAANTVDGLTAVACKWLGLGTTSVNSFILTADAVDRVILKQNFVCLARTATAAALMTVTTGALTNLDCANNRTYTQATATTGGGLISAGGTAATGMVAENYQQTRGAATDILFTTTIGLGAFENRVSGAVGATGFVIPAVDS